MSTAPMKCAVIGAGNMGKNHVRVYSQLPAVQLVGVADLNEELGAFFVDKYAITYYKDFKEMLTKERPEMVSVCVPTLYHHQVASYCLNQGIHVLLEKPIAMTVEQGQSLIDTAKSNNVKLLTGHIERFNPAVQKVKDMLNKNELGKVINIMARRVGGFPPQIRDADIAVDLAIHDVDIVNYLLDEIPLKVVAHKQRNLIEERDDAVTFFMEYKQASSYIQANWVTPVKIRKLTITGTEGYLEVDYVNQKIEFYKSHYDRYKESEGDYSDYILCFSEPDIITISVAKKEPLREEILYFLNCIRNNLTVSSDFALEALKIVTAN